MKKVKKMIMLSIAMLCLIILSACGEKTSTTITLVSVTGEVTGARVTLKNNSGDKSLVYTQTAKGTTVDFKNIVPGSYTLTVEHNDFNTFTQGDITVHNTVAGYTANLINKEILVFFDKGAISDGWRYLVAAPANTDFVANWDSAVSKCNELVIYGLTGWTLPDMDQLILIYENLHLKGLGGFQDDYYWSSLQSSDHSAWFLDFNLGQDQDSHSAKSDTYRVRAILAF